VSVKNHSIRRECHQRRRIYFFNKATRCERREKVIVTVVSKRLIKKKDDMKRNGSSKVPVSPRHNFTILIGWSIDTFLQYKYNPCLLRTGTPTPTPTFSPPSFFFYNTGRYETNLRNNRCLYNIQHIHRVAFVFCTNLKYNLELAIGTGLVGRECSNTAWSNC
jgi:hypothetical protein